MRFKIGDKVRLIRIKEDERTGPKAETYVRSIGKIFTIKNIFTLYASLMETNIEPYLSDLELVSKKFTKSDLKDGDIVTYRCGNKRTVKGGRLIDEEGSTVNILINYNDDLTQRRIKENDIIKVERPVKYETVFERKEEILDETEKRYLRNVIRPFRNRVRFIEKEDDSKIARIKICFDYHFMFFPTLEKEKKMYEGMQPNRAYTLKELGL